MQTAIILAGGLGTRLRPVVNDRPKVLAMVHGEPFLTYLLRRCVRLGVEKIILATGYRADAVAATYGDHFESAALVYSVETEPLGTGGALRLAAGQVETDRVLVMNGDSYCTANLAAFETWHEQHGAVASLVLIESDDTARYGNVVVGDDSRVQRFSEKVVGQGWINAGVYIMAKDRISTIPAARSVSLEREVFPQWAAQDNLYGYRTSGRLLDIGTPDSYAQAAKFLAKV